MNDFTNSRASDNPTLAYQSQHDWRVYRTDDPVACLFRAGMSIDADGAPRAYHPDGCPPGLDYLDNAGTPGKWWGIATDNGKKWGNPLIQGPNEPAPGFYVSATALVDPRYNGGEQRRYVDASTVPYVVLPRDYPDFQLNSRIGKGDLAMVHYPATGRTVAAIFADVGNRKHLGEGSIALAEALGLSNSSPTNGGVSGPEILYVVFPGSGNGKPRTREEIDAIATEAFENWGGLRRLLAIQEQLD